MLCHSSDCLVHPPLYLHSSPAQLICQTRLWLFSFAFSRCLCLSTWSGQQTSAVLLHVEWPHLPPQVLRDSEVSTSPPQVSQRLFPRLRGCRCGGRTHKSCQRLWGCVCVYIRRAVDFIHILTFKSYNGEFEWVDFSSEGFCLTQTILSSFFFFYLWTKTHSTIAISPFLFG